MDYYALAYYRFTPLDQPAEEIRKHKEFFKDRDMAGRIYISEEGINGQTSGSLADAEAYMTWLKSDTRFADLHFKVHTCKENIFPRMTVKYRKQLVALDTPTDLEQGGEHISPHQWREMMENEKGAVVIDVRNDYESEIGHFEKAVRPPLKYFRDFPSYAERLKEEVDPTKTKVMMYCTGGIRCELYSALLKEKGFKHVYQLDGGIINYGLKEGSAHWKGKVFVFDDRMAIPIDGKECTPITECLYCNTPCDTHYNCANMDCNTLFLSCPDCLQTHHGCCQEACESASRVRPFDASRGNKPFRRKHLTS